MKNKRLPMHKDEWEFFCQKYHIIQYGYYSRNTLFDRKGNLEHYYLRKSPDSGLIEHTYHHDTPKISIGYFGGVIDKIKYSLPLGRGWKMFESYPAYGEFTPGQHNGNNRQPEYYTSFYDDEGAGFGDPFWAADCMGWRTIAGDMP